ncbi:MAG: NADH-quinone oxidoreductase subunit N [Deltaproteobacteria bacterium]|jgi:NADH-quinone oxidoreductase subunit N|nr:NADH-quinone oxidoreductase subunit N [Deltaproteobacteria bacterium]
MAKDLNFNFSYIWPETVFFILVLYLFVATMLSRKYPKMATFAGLWPIPALGIVATILAGSSFHLNEAMFFNSYRIDGLSQFFKVLISLGFVLAAINSFSQPTLAKSRKVEYFLYLTLSAWGLVILSSANELVTIYLALELSSYSLYILIPVRAHSKEAAEAGLKYILFGAAATAIALYGLSWIVAAQETTYINALASLSWTVADKPLAVMGLTLFLGGMFFKLALFPFHFWCPDVYQGASNETAAFVATLPKLGAIIVLIRLATLLKPNLEITAILAVLAAVSVTYGNLCALVQKDLKRMLGFSSVAHAGYILVGLVAGTAEGLAAAAFYAMAYLFMNLLAFWVIGRISQDGRNLTYDDLNGLAERSPVLALCLAAAAFSLVSLPPTVGFIGKLWLITSLWGHGHDWLVIVVCVNSAIAIYYYLSLVRHAYTEDPFKNVAKPKASKKPLETASAVASAAASAVVTTAEGEVPEGPVKVIDLTDTSAYSYIGALFLGLLVFLLGVFPSPVYSLVLAAAKGLLP